MITKLNLTTAYNENHKQIYFFVYRYVNNVEYAEQICSDVWLKAHRLNESEKFGYDSEISEVSTWLHKIAYSCYVDFMRTNHSDHYKPVSSFVNSEGDEISFQFESPAKSDSLVINKELEIRLDKAFYELNSENRRIASMYFRQGMKQTEIAEMFNIPLGTVKVTLSRARELLKQELKGLYIPKKRKTNVQVEAE